MTVMSISDWLAIGGVLLAVIAGLLRHVQVDARYRARLHSIEHRLKKLDGIGANGN